LVTIRVKSVKVTDIAKVTEMAKMAGMSKDYVRAARHATIHPVSKMADMSNMTTRHVMCSLSEPAV
jgi:hypothetical protein